MTIVQLGNTSFRSARRGSAKTMKSCSTSYHHLPSMATSKTSRAHCHGIASSFFGRHVASQFVERYEMLDLQTSHGITLENVEKGQADARCLAESSRYHRARRVREYEETEPRSQGGPAGRTSETWNSARPDHDQTMTRPWPIQTFSSPLFISARIWRTCFLEDNFAVSKIRGPKVGQGQLRLRNSHNTQVKKNTSAGILV